MKVTNCESLRYTNFSILLLFLPYSNFFSKALIVCSSFQVKDRAVVMVTQQLTTPPGKPWKLRLVEKCALLTTTYLWCFNFKCLWVHLKRNSTKHYLKICDYSAAKLVTWYRDESAATTGSLRINTKFNTVWLGLRHVGGMDPPPRAGLMFL
jgi:hypothetical protein